MENIRNDRWDLIRKKHINYFLAKRSRYSVILRPLVENVSNMRKKHDWRDLHSANMFFSWCFQKNRLERRLLVVKEMSTHIHVKVIHKWIHIHTHTHSHTHNYTHISKYISLSVNIHLCVSGEAATKTTIYYWFSRI